MQNIIRSIRFNTMFVLVSIFSRLKINVNLEIQLHYIPKIIEFQIYVVFDCKKTQHKLEIIYFSLCICVHFIDAAHVNIVLRMYVAFPSHNSHH